MKRKHWEAIEKTSKSEKDKMLYDIFCVCYTTLYDKLYIYIFFAFFLFSLHMMRCTRLKILFDFFRPTFRFERYHCCIMHSRTYFSSSIVHRSIEVLTKIEKKGYKRKREQPTTKMDNFFSIFLKNTKTYTKDFSIFFCSLFFIFLLFLLWRHSIQRGSFIALNCFLRVKSMKWREFLWKISYVRHPNKLVTNQTSSASLQLFYFFNIWFQSPYHFKFFCFSLVPSPTERVTLPHRQ